jgi:SAM-dependent methyltransferase
MTLPPEPNHDQSTAWNGASGRAWVEIQSLLDQMFMPFETLLRNEVAATSRVRRVLDVGCGTGSTTLAVTRQLGADGHGLGVDISAPMIALARQRASAAGLPADFVCADAQVHAFERGSVDMIVSRFGVMFFEDPAQAFTNLRQAARPDAQLSVIAWRSAADNPFMTTAEHAAAPLLPSLPVRRPGAPGQFAFADRDRVAGILAQSGWADVDIQPIDVDCLLPERELVRYLSWLGPVGAMLQQADETTRHQVIAAMRPAFEPFVQGDEVRYTAACWMIRARA